MDKKERPLLIIFCPVTDNYGLSRTALAIANNSVLSGYRVNICFPKNRDTGVQLNLLKNDYISYVPLQMNVIARSEFRNLLSPRFLINLGKNQMLVRKYIRNSNPEYIHVMSASCIFVLLSLFGMRKKILHSLHESPRSRIEAGVIRVISRIFSSTQVACSNYVKDIFKLPNANVIHSGADVKRFANLNARTPSLETPTGMVCIGRLNSWKGQMFLLEVATKLKSEGLLFHLDIIGSSFPGELDYSFELKDKILSEGLEDSVMLLGEIPNWEDKASNYSFCFVPSQIPEPFGKVVIEAMAAGLIVISSDQGGPRDVITDHIDGFLVNPSDVDAYVACIKMTLGDLELWRSISSRARSRASEFTENKAASLYLQLYRKKATN